jgi:hypothetical protein
VTFSKSQSTALALGPARAQEILQAEVFAG